MFVVFMHIFLYKHYLCFTRLSNKENISGFHQSKLNGKLISVVIVLQKYRQYFIKPMKFVEKMIRQKRLVICENFLRKFL